MHPIIAPLQSQAINPNLSGNINYQDVHICITRILAAVLSVLIMLALKRHYSQATAAQLDWILAPTAKLVAWLTSAHPVYESGVGYVDFTHGIIVAPACAGVNFMIMAFGLAALCGIVELRRMAGLLVWLASTLLGAYGYTLMVNTIRIGLSMVLYRADIYGTWLTVERLHRLAGIGLYLGALWLLFKGLRIIMQHNCRRYHPYSREKGCHLPNWLPLCWYVAGAVGVPLVNLLFQQYASSFGEHCITVLIASTCLWGMAKWVRRLFKGACQNFK